MIEYLLSDSGETLWINDIGAGMTMQINDVEELRKLLGVKNE